MRVEIADVQRDRERLAGFLCNELEAHSCRQYYEWIYLLNPAGRAHAWALVDERDTLLGAAAAFPRQWSAGGRNRLAWILGDFAIRADQRSLGPALMLQRACLAPVLSGEIDLAYDHPSESMLAIYRRMGGSTEGRLVRYALPLRVDTRVSETIRPAMLARGLATLGNLGLSLARRARLSGGRRVTPLEGRFDERADALGKEAAAGSTVCGFRGAAFLNWRFLDHPLHRHQVFVLEDGERLLGWVVLRLGRSTAVLCDLVAPGEEWTGTALVAAAAEAALEAGATTLSAPTLECTNLARLLTRLGFRARESTPFVVTTGAEGDLAEAFTDFGRWVHSEGDRDG